MNPVVGPAHSGRLYLQAGPLHPGAVKALREIRFHLSPTCACFCSDRARLKSPKRLKNLSVILRALMSRRALGKSVTRLGVETLQSLFLSHYNAISRDKDLIQNPEGLFAGSRNQS